MMKYLSRYKLGFAIILLATLVFFSPILNKLGSYSEGGDAMFNSWLIARNQHCLLRQGCPDYTTANIYFPHQDTMLYSETELSIAFLTLPLHFVNHNPIFAYNVWTILSFFFAGLFMYMLAMYLSRNNQILSIASGLIFEFAPVKMASVSHLQNLSIFYLPLIILLLLKYFDKPRGRLLIGLFAALVLQFYASWYQMVFVLIPVGIFIIAKYIQKPADLRKCLSVAGVAIIAIIATLPLAIEYVQFGKTSGANFGIEDQIKYSASLPDYIIPYSGTLLGKIYYHLSPNAQHNSYNPDSFSYVSFTLLLVFAAMILFVISRRKVAKIRETRFHVWTFAAVALVGFLISLGPALKLDQNLLDFTDKASGQKITFAMPYLLVDKFLPQLSFIRATGRASILVLFALCSSLAIFATLNSYKFGRIKPKLFPKISIIIVLLLAIEMMPLHRMVMAEHSYNYNLKVPQVYEYIKRQPDVNDIIILAADPDYTPKPAIPMQRAEWVLWAGYHNKNIFNGYSGYTPEKYFDQYGDFLDFDKSDVKDLQALGIKYVLVDKMLSSERTKLISDVRDALGFPVYEDQRYMLEKVPNQ